MSIERRLQRLEREARSWRRTSIALLGLIALLLATGASDSTVADIVRARRIQLVGGDGDAQLLADLAGDGKGDAQLVLYSHEGRPLVELKPRAGDGVVRTYNVGGYPLVELGVTGAHEGELAVYNHDGHRLVYARPTEAGSGAVFTLNEEGFGLIELGAREDGRARVRMLDGKGRLLAAMDSTQEGAGSLTSYNIAGHRVAALDSKPNGKGRVVAYDGAGNLTNEWPSDDGGTVDVAHTVRARNVEIVSNDGREVLVRLTQAEDGQGLIITYTADGKDTIKIGTGGGRGGQISRYDGDGNLTHEWPGTEERPRSEEPDEDTKPGASGDPRSMDQ